jgi:hypothetical protein
MRCNRCNVEMTEGKALAQTITAGAPDFHGSDVVTFSAGGPGRIVPCWKCPKCGRSVEMVNLEKKTVQVV